ncbi:MAG: ABC transporter ATP-binding protein [Elusimicrobiota bacterium]|mgnify:CR=1 FL=1
MAETVIELRGLKKTYGKGAQAVPVLRGLDVRVEAGQFVVVLGPSGCGKSTLLNILGLMDEPTSGEVLFSGRPSASLDEGAKARLRNEKLGFVFQFDSLLPEFTMLENVTMPARIALAQGRSTEPLAGAGRRALALMEGLGLKGLQDRFPSETSGGERQRAALCRALINRPACLLADEPTGNLDKANGEVVFKDLKALAQTHGTAVVMVTHNEEAARFADRILRMLDGTIREGPERIL